MRRSRKRRLKSAGAAVAYVAMGAVVCRWILRHKAPPAAPAVRPAAVSGAEAALDRVLPELDLEAVPFSEAVERVRRATGAPIVLDRANLLAGGINLDAPVTVRMRNATLQHALGELGRAASTRLCGVGAGPTGDIILVTDGETLSRRCTSMHLYDVRDLIAAAESDPWRSAEDTVIYETVVQRRRWSPAEELVNLVENMVASDSWKEAGGVTGTIHYFAGRLAVVQTWENHRQIARLLARLRTPGQSDEPPPAEPDLMLWDQDLGRYVSTRSEEGESALRRRLAEVQLDGVELDDAVGALARLARANLASDWRAIEAAGPGPHGRVSLHLHDVTLADALRALFTVTGGGNNLCFDPDGAYVRLTARDADRPVRTLTYDVRDLLTSAAGPPPEGVAAREAWRSAKALAVDRLSRSIQSTVDPDSWKDNGGKAGAIRELSGRLIVTQTWENQQKVADLLAALRADPVRLRAALTPRSGPATEPAAGANPNPSTLPAAPTTAPLNPADR